MVSYKDQVAQGVWIGYKGYSKAMLTILDDCSCENLSYDFRKNSKEIKNKLYNVIEIIFPLSF